MLITKNFSKTLLIVIFFWIINEILQVTEVFYKYEVFNFLVFHLSSLYGAIIFCFLITYLKLNKTFMIGPIAIEIFQSWVSCRCFDYWDLIFSISGILIVIVILTLEKNKLNSNEHL